MTGEHPEEWSPKVDQDAIQIALDDVETEAGRHNAEYAAGMRHARLIFEKSLLVDV